MDGAEGRVAQVCAWKDKPNARLRREGILGAWTAALKHCPFLREHIGSPVTPVPPCRNGSPEKLGNMLIFTWLVNVCR